MYLFLLLLACCVLIIIYLVNCSKHQDPFVPFINKHYYRIKRKLRQHGQKQYEKYITPLIITGKRKKFIW